jgi:hypothetical protein
MGIIEAIGSLVAFGIGLFFYLGPFFLVWIIIRRRKAKRAREQTILRAFSYDPPTYYNASFLSDEQLKELGLLKRRRWWL